MTTIKSNKPIVSIGIPVYNGANFLRQRINSILTQTFQDFELIISDNASTDITSDICREFAIQDKRIRYIKQQNNIGPFNNFNFVLHQACGKYFTWAAVDDFWETEFLQKNIDNLESDQNLVGSISQVDFYGENKQKYDGHYTKENFPRYRHVHPISGSWNKKVEFYLKFAQATMVYAVYRTEKLKNCMFTSHHPKDLFIILNVLKYGDLHVHDEILMHRYAGGLSSKPILHSLKQQDMGNVEIIFMYVPFMSWCIKNFGLGFIIKNTPSLIKLHCVSYGRIVLDLIRFSK